MYKKQRDGSVVSKKSNDLIKLKGYNAKNEKTKISTGIYYIILRGTNREIIFQDDEDKEKFIELLKKYKEVSKYEVYAFVLWIIMYIFS